MGCASTKSVSTAGPWLSEKEIIHLWKECDKDNTGYLTRQEIRELLLDQNKAKINISEEHIEEILDSMDPEREGRVSYQHFHDMLMGKLSHTQPPN